MGADYSNHWLFTGVPDARARPGEVIAVVARAFAELGLVEVATESSSDRSVVLAPAGRWVFIGDTAGTTDTADPEGFEALSRALSTLGPVVDINMSDSAIVHIHLSARAGTSTPSATAFCRFICSRTRSKPPPTAESRRSGRT